MPLGSELATTEPLTDPLVGNTAMYCTPGGLFVVTGATVWAKIVGRRVAVKPRMGIVERMPRMIKGCRCSMILLAC